MLEQKYNWKKELTKDDLALDIQIIMTVTWIYFIASFSFDFPLYNVIVNWISINVRRESLRTEATMPRQNMALSTPVVDDEIWLQGAVQGSLAWFKEFQKGLATAILNSDWNEDKDTVKLSGKREGKTDNGWGAKREGGEGKQEENTAHRTLADNRELHIC